jgi:hypothetical protein
LMLGYAFAYYTALSSDVIHGLLHPADGMWQTWYWGIGGAGFHDGLFLAPILGLFAVLLTRFGKWLSVALNRAAAEHGHGLAHSITQDDSNA